MILRRLVVFALTLTCLLDGCGPPDRQEAANQLTKTIRQMPGVRDVTVSSTNDFEQGSTVNIYVFLPDAPSKLIEAVVARINSIRGDEFARYDQTAEFAVTPSRTVLVKRGAELDPHAVAVDADGLRKLTSDAGATDAVIFRNTSTADLKLTKVTARPDDVFAAVRTGFGDNARLQLTLSSTASDTPSWHVAFPYSAADQRRVDQQLAALPAPAFAVTVGGGGTIAELGISLHNRGAAYQDLVATISAVGAGTAHPVTVRWQLDGDNGSQQFSGSVNVGACQYISNSEGERHPEKYLTPDASALQQRMRTQFDTCPK